jgi:HPt (histidine-containing phosphotransfer) domain-containing protein
LQEIPQPVRFALDGLRALGGDSLARQMVAVFSEHSAERIRLLQEAADRGDLKSVAESAHTLKGSARQLGLTEMADACLAVELAAKRGDPEATQTLAAAVHETYTTAAEWLEAATA